MKTDQNIFKSSGLIFFKDFMVITGFITLLEKRIIDLRNPSYINFSKTELLTNMILRTLDGEMRLSHQNNRVNEVFYQQCNYSGKISYGHSEGIKKGYIVGRKKTFKKILFKQN